MDTHTLAKISQSNRPRMASTFVIDLNQEATTRAKIEAVDVKSVGDMAHFDTHQLECVKIEKHGKKYLVFLHMVRQHQVLICLKHVTSNLSEM